VAFERHHLVGLRLPNLIHRLLLGVDRIDGPDAALDLKSSQ